MAAFLIHAPFQPARDRGLAAAACRPRPHRSASKARAKWPSRLVTMRVTDDDDDDTTRTDHTHHAAAAGGSDRVYGDSAYGDGDAAVDAAARTPSMSELKAELYAAACTANRGFLASTEARRAIECTIEELERLNPTASPTEAPDMFIGTWRLLYTNALDVLSLGLLSPVALVNQVYQNISQPSDATLCDFDVDNVVELEPSFAPVTNAFVGRTMGKLVVKARAEKQSSSIIALTFDNVSFQPQTLFGSGVPVQIRTPKVPLKSAVGSIDTTFLDEDLRVSRVVVGGGKNVFVLARDSYAY